MIFFMVEGTYDISKDTCRCDLYGDEAVQFPDSPYSMSMVMKEDGKMAWTTLQLITSVLGCSVDEAIEKTYISIYLGFKNKRTFQNKRVI